MGALAYLHLDGTEGGKLYPRCTVLDNRSRFLQERHLSLPRLVAPTDEEFAAGAYMPGGLLHFPNGTDAEGLKQWPDEQSVKIKTDGFQRLEWQKLRERNEALDCRVYARAAAWIAGADRWTQAMWRAEV